MGPLVKRGEEEAMKLSLLLISLTLKLKIAEKVNLPKKKKQINKSSSNIIFFSPSFPEVHIHLEGMETAFLQKYNCIVFPLL